MKLIQFVVLFATNERDASRKRATALLLTLISAAALQAEPTLFGSTATINYLYPNQATGADRPTSDVSFTGNSIEFNAVGLSFYNAPYTIKLDLDTASTAPEPATVALRGLAFIGLGSRKVRKRWNSWGTASQTAGKSGL